MEKRIVLSNGHSIRSDVCGMACEDEFLYEVLSRLQDGASPAEFAECFAACADELLATPVDSYRRNHDNLQRREQLLQHYNNTLRCFEWHYYDDGASLRAELAKVAERHPCISTPGNVPNADYYVDTARIASIWLIAHLIQKRKLDAISPEMIDAEMDYVWYFDQICYKISNRTARNIDECVLRYEDVVELNSGTEWLKNEISAANASLSNLSTGRSVVLPADFAMRVSRTSVRVAIGHDFFKIYEGPSSQPLSAAQVYEIGRQDGARISFAEYCGE
ncbi:hypothetical protein IJ847_02230 [Candidatus Saccharibacteria bacterium]|nr:hypothetical protein [Candidatus Saccharibacteria bacterium]